MLDTLTMKTQSSFIPAVSLDGASVGASRAAVFSAYRSRPWRSLELEAGKKAVSQEYS